MQELALYKNCIIIKFTIYILSCVLFSMQSVDCKIIKKSNSGFDVELLPSKMAALLPKMHLSDHLGICDLLWDAHEEGDIIKGAVYISRTNVIVSFWRPTGSILIRLDAVFR